LLSLIIIIIHFDAFFTMPIQSLKHNNTMTY